MNTFGHPHEGEGSGREFSAQEAMGVLSFSCMATVSAIYIYLPVGWL